MVSLKKTHDFRKSNVEYVRQDGSGIISKKSIISVSKKLDRRSAYGPDHLRFDMGGTTGDVIDVQEVNSLPGGLYNAIKKDKDSVDISDMNLIDISSGTRESYRMGDGKIYKILTKI